MLLLLLGRATVDFLKESLENEITAEINKNNGEDFDLPEFLRRLITVKCSLK